MENRLGDLWSLFDSLCPGLLGSEAVFGRYVKQIMNPRDNPYAGLRALVRPYILRRLKTDRSIIADLPEKVEVKVLLPLTKTQATLYEQSVRDLSRRLSESDGIQRRGLVLSYLMRFKQICNHPSQWLGDGNYGARASGKFHRLRDPLRRDGVPAGKGADLHPVPRDDGASVGGAGRDLSTARADPARRDTGQKAAGARGSLSAGRRPSVFRSFPQGGGRGAESDGSLPCHPLRPLVEPGRGEPGHRSGLPDRSEKNVLVHKFVCRGTIEERIDALIEEKKDLAEGILGAGGEKLLTEMPDDELLRFVSLDLDRALEDENDESNGKTRRKGK